MCVACMYVYHHFINQFVSGGGQPNNVSAFMECVFCNGKANNKRCIQINKINSNLMIILRQRRNNSCIRENDGTLIRELWKEAFQVVRFEWRFKWKERANYERSEEHCLLGRRNSKDEDSQTGISLQGGLQQKKGLYDGGPCTPRSVWEKVWDPGSIMGLLGPEYLKEKVYFNLSAVYEFFIVTKTMKQFYF